MSYGQNFYFYGRNKLLRGINFFLKALHFITMGKSELSIVPVDVGCQHISTSLFGESFIFTKHAILWGFAYPDGPDNVTQTVTNDENA